MLIPHAAVAQLRVGVAGGPVFPVGDFGDALERGGHGGVVLDFGVPLFPVSLRGDLMVQRLPATEGNGLAYRHFAGTVNARVDVLPVPLIAAYVTGGVGLYYSDYTDDPQASSGWGTETGLNLGVGASLSLLFVRPFAELRYHHVWVEPTRIFVPLTFGLSLF